jgi:hypothetical protein
MDELTKEIIEELRSTSTYEGFVNMVVASRMIGSNQLYKDGVQQLISSEIVPNMEQSKRMGVEATHTIMKEIMNSIISERNAVQSEMNQRVAVVRKEKATAIANLKAKMAQALAKSDNCIYCGR